MCGIAGLVSYNFTEDTAQKAASTMINTLKSRGPDDQGYFFDSGSSLLLVHTRLAIHDLSPNGHQPMFSNSSRYIIAFNGEIYNFQDLKNTLVAKGITFEGTSDTEVLLSCIEQYGVESTLEKCIGMYSFALWDTIDKKMYLCRDRLGEKPLYYGWINDQFFFCSQLHAIESISESKSLNISAQSLNIYLKYGYIPAPHSIYENTYKLLPGTYATIDLNRKVVAEENIKIFQYWSVQEEFKITRDSQITDYKEAIFEVEQKIRNSVKQQLQADVEVGVFLSGGVDSSIVASIAQSISKHKIKTFTIGFESIEYDESKFAEEIAAHLKTDHTTIQLTNADLLRIVPSLGAIYDEPFADSSQIPAYMVSKKAKEHVTVCLSGDGGDELFSGYNRYKSTKKLWNYSRHIPYPIRCFIAYLLESTPNKVKEGLISIFYKNKQGSINSKLQKIVHVLKSKDIHTAYDKLISYWQEPSSIQKNSIENYRLKLSEEFTHRIDFLNYAMLLDQIYYLEGDNLVKTDRASMANSLETRLPLLSKELVELAWRIPSEFKVRNNESKWILKEVLYNYVPKKLIDRPKMGFSVPIADWLRSDLKVWAEELLATVFNDSDPHLKKEQIQKAWNEHQSSEFDHSNRLWTILMFLAWKRERGLN